MHGLRSLAAAAAVAALLLTAATPAFSTDSASSESGKPVAAATAKDDSAGSPSSGEQAFLASLDSDEAAGRKSDEPSLYVTVVGFLARLALVLLLAYGTIYALKRFGGLKAVAGQGSQRIRVVEHANLAANRALHLVEVGSRKLLISSTPNQVSLIAELSQHDLPASEDVGPGASFGDQLQSLLGRKPDSGSAAFSVAATLRESASFFQDKVQGIASLRGKLRDA